VDDVRFQDVAVCLAEVDPLLHHRARGWRVVQSRPPVRCLHPGGEVLGEVLLVGIEMLGQRLARSEYAPSSTPVLRASSASVFICAR
jgi:hypothetical protein